MGFTERQLTEMTGRIKLISFADKKFYGNQRLLNLSARKNGIKYISSYSDKWLRNQSVFWIENNLILTKVKYYLKAKKHQFWSKTKFLFYFI